MIMGANKTDLNNFFLFFFSNVTLVVNYYAYDMIKKSILN